MSRATTSNGVSHVRDYLPLLSQLDQEIHQDNKDRDFWWGALSEPLASLLQANQYSKDVQLSYLRWFHTWVLPALGPRPVDGKPFYGSWITHDLSPLEYSLNWKEKSAKTTVRFTLEPVTKHAGTAADPINQLGAQEFLNSISADVPGLDLTRFHEFVKATNVPEDCIDDAIAKHPSHFPRSRVWIAFDLEHSGSLVAKAYYLPHWLAIQSGISANTIIFDAIRASNTAAHGASYDGSIAAIESYLSTQQNAPQVGLLANDCVADTAGSRLKVYFRSAVDTLAGAKDMYHLGGRLKGPTVAAALKGISDFWYHLFGLDGSDPTSDDKICVAGEHKCIFVYEMRSTQGSEPDLDVKFHIPMWQLGKTDAQLSDLLASWFESHGDHDLAGRYKSDLETAFPNGAIETSVGTHTYLSITYTPKTGLYMTMYLSPKLPGWYF
ncbi:unnamed protein product [Discula destructiva]